ncbi:MAG: hypothetical protein NTY03_04315 [Candidatus Bathyarchaeota archaeon]|nr:hypothetical protein [Candidatus Bathyarchaeota archaeon]
MGILDSLEDIGGHSGSTIRMITDFRVLAIVGIVIILMVCALVYLFTSGVLR